MPIGSPPSDKYVVYTLDNNEDTSCSSGLEDGQIVFRDPEHVSLQEKPDSKRNGNGRIRSVSFESSTHWGQRGSMRMKCCCFWNIILVIALVSVTVNFIITLGDYKNLKSSWANINNTDNQAEATPSTVSPTPADVRQEHVNFDRYKVCETSDCIHQAASVLSRMNTNANPCEVETNPGPSNLNDSSYPCSICSHECTWDSDAIVCDNCDKWCHIGCVNISPSMYEKFGNSSALWICPICDTPNHSRTIFQSYLSSGNSVLNPNSYSVLSDSSAFSLSFNINDSHENFGDPVATSSPKPPVTKQLKNKNINRQNSLRVLQINFRSCKNKVPQIENLLTSSKPDIIIGNETWLNKDVLSSEIFPNTLFEDVFRNDRVGKEGGGVLIAIKKGIICQEVYKSKNVELIAAQINITDTKSLIIISAYRPPNKNDLDYLKQMIIEINELKLKFKNSTFWLGGDFNLPDIKWPEQNISGSMYTKELNEAFIDMLNNLGIEQMVDFPTRKDNILDLFCTNQPALITKIKSIPGISDHDIVLVDAICKPQRSKQSQHKIYLWKKVDIKKIKDITSHFISELISQANENLKILTNYGINSKKVVIK
ncbi:Hypothetical predicted protein [Mytilus galloprovincialis]|uniref:PHD-type domain-containing protein n=1 Tax=Mytilus galloprovincialis TaxID=29158 RepID=A0A8B6FB04_MYTGA|nr:Hypothetical predicted protein [Mytilus galloprovincialis]